MRRLLATLGLLGVLAVTGPAVAGASESSEPKLASAPRSATRPEALAVAPDQATIVLYGDSLAWEARDHFRDALVAAGVGNVSTFTFGGTAICDWLDEMRADAARLRPSAVVVEFSGNALTPCMMDAAGQSLAVSPSAYHGKYAADAHEVVSIFSATGTRVYFAGAPKTLRAEEIGDPESGWLNTLYAEVARDDHARYVDAGAAVLDHGHWTDTLPCLATEPCTGGTDAESNAINVVRAPDGGHFCPGATDAQRGVTDTCPVWASGAYRYGRAMAGPVIRDLHAATSAVTAIAIGTIR